MNQDNQNFSLAKDLLIRLGAALENGDLSTKELPFLAGFILSNIDYIYSDDDRYVFLMQLTRRWPWLKTVAQTHLIQIENPQNVRNQMELLAKGMQLMGTSYS